METPDAPKPKNHDSKIWDNHSRGAAADWIRNNISEQSAVAIVSAYFTIHAYMRLKGSLEKPKEIRFLFGEPTFVSQVDADKSASKAFALESDHVGLANVLEQSKNAKECADWLRRIVQVRSIKQTRLLHGKLYHVKEGKHSEALIGSSNFTVPGLGLGDHGHNNFELNIEASDDRDKNGLLEWFNDLWTDETMTEDVKEEVLKYLAQVYVDRSPEFIYFKTLFHLFPETSDDTTTDELLEKKGLFESDIWKKLYDFQKDGVRAIINKLQAFNGCILADSVGLGKTYEALAVIKYYELRNERVLVLCPKKLKENWDVYTRNDKYNELINDRFAYKVLFHTDLSRESGDSNAGKLETFNWGNFDLIVIDESHNFRNNTPGERDEDGNVVKKSRYERLLQDVIRSGARTKVLLLSATPVNTSMKDLRNQLRLISAGDDAAFKSSLGVDNVEVALRIAQAEFLRWSKKPAHERRKEDLIASLSANFFTLLDHLTIARSRKHIENFYKETVVQLGAFPKRLKPIAINCEVDTKARFLNFDRVSEQIDKFKLSLYIPSRYLKPEAREKYEAKGTVKYFTQTDREDFLADMMRVNLLSRLESSVFSFALTLERMIVKIEEIQARIRDRSAVTIEGGLDFSADENSSLEGAGEEYVGKKLKYSLEDLDLTKWGRALEQDKQELHALLLGARDVTPDRDAKLEALMRIIKGKASKPTINRGGEPIRKVLVFTAFADTAIYLFDNLSAKLKSELKVESACITGSENKSTLAGGVKFEDLLLDFSPRSKGRSTKRPGNHPEIDVIFATDCISEGQNLQDCDMVVNYDIHWNPVRIVQRFGRVDRIGSRHDAVQLVNFWPTEDLDKYLSKKSRVETRMTIVNISATGSDDILTEDLEKDIAGQEHAFRVKQLQRLRDEVLSMDDVGAVSLGDFSLDDFRAQLRNFLEKDRAELAKAPMGLYSVVSAEGDGVSQGVIMCLRRKSEDGTKAGQEIRRINPLAPYYLVYAHEDGSIKYAFAQSKQVLELFRKLAEGKKHADEKLTELFNQQTADGKEMEKYTKVFRSAAKAIAASFAKKTLSAVSVKGGLLPAADELPTDDLDGYELVTWLVLLRS
jgi:superfamily II DNA/RNA helicase